MMPILCEGKMTPILSNVSKIDDTYDEEKIESGHPFSHGKSIVISLVDSARLIHLLGDEPASIS